MDFPCIAHESQVLWLFHVYCMCSVTLAHTHYPIHGQLSSVGGCASCELYVDGKRSALFSVSGVCFYVSLFFLLFLQHPLYFDFFGFVGSESSLTIH